MKYRQSIRACLLLASFTPAIAFSDGVPHEHEAYGEILSNLLVRVRLWPDVAPCETNAEWGRFAYDGKDKVWRRHGVSCPELMVFRPSFPTSKTMVVDLPGGGYVSHHMGSIPHFGRKTLDSGRFYSVLHYRIPRRQGRKIYEAPREDLARAVRWLRFHAKEYGWGLDAIGVVGFSAGGNLSVRAAVGLQDTSCAPFDALDSVSAHIAFAVARSPAYLLGADGELLPELVFGKNTPPMLILHGDADDVCSPMESVKLYVRLHRQGIPAQLMIYSCAAHGLNDNVNVRGWRTCILDWLESWNY